MEELNFKPINPVERKRTYLFPNDQKVTFTQVDAICVRPSGTHRLTCEEGMVVVPAGWLAIVIDTDKWSF
jgi:hypothetical protein